MIGGNHHPRRDAGRREVVDRPQAGGGGAGAGFHAAGEGFVQRCHADRDVHDVELGHFGEQVEIAGDEAVFGDDADRLAGFEGHLEATAGEAKAAFGRLVAIGDAGEANHFGLPVVASQPLAKKLGGPLFDEDLRLEVEAGAQAEVLVAGPGVAVAAAVLAAAVGVQAEAEGDVGAVVFGDDALGTVEDELRANAVLLRQARRCECRGGRIVFVIRLVLEREEPIRRIDRPPAPLSSAFSDHP